MKTAQTKVKKAFSLLMALVMITGLIPAAFASAAVKKDGKWMAVWGTAPVDYYISLEDYVPNFLVNGKFSAGTLTRTELSVSAAGEKLRLKFSNEYGKKEVSFTNASVARTDTSRKGAIDTSTAVPLTFGGSRTAVIPAGGEIWSDEISFTTRALDKLTVTLYYDRETPVKTAGLFFGNTYCAPALSAEANNDIMIGASEISIATGVNAYHVIPFLTTIETYTRAENARSVVFIGDSTLVNKTTDYLSQRLVDAGEENIALVNKCIMGNRLFYNGHGLIGNLYGESVTDRFERDALSIAGCEAIIVKIGVNDVLHPASKSMGAQAPYVSAEDIINGYKNLVKLAHEKGIRIYFMEITPWNGYVRDILGSKGDISWREDLQKMCDECNEWIKTNTVADGYIDSAPLSKPNDPTAFRSQFTKDGIHLTDIGALALADCVDIENIFGVKDARTAAEINGVDPYSSKYDSTINKIILKLKNVLVFIRQLLSSLRLEYGPVQELIDKIINALPSGFARRNR